MKRWLVVGIMVVLLDVAMKVVSPQWTPPQIGVYGQWVFGLGYLESNYFGATVLVDPVLRVVGGLVVFGLAVAVMVRARPNRVARRGFILVSCAAVGNGGELLLRGFVTDYLVYGTLTVPLVANLSDVLGAVGTLIVMASLAWELAAEIRIAKARR